MKRFIYKAKDKSAKTVTGEVEASTETAAARLVSKRELTVISIRPKISPWGFLGDFKKKVPLSEVTSLTRQLATMVNAGLPITDALLIIKTQSKGEMQKVITQILAEVDGGASLSLAFSKHPKVFSPSYIALLKSGEAGGVMDQVLSRLADNLEKDQEFKGKVKGALIYPIIIVIGMFVVGFIMMVFVIPKLITLYQEFDAKLPLPTRILIAFSGFLTKFWPVLLVLTVGGIYGFFLYAKTKKGRRKIDELVLKIPVVGPLQKQILLTELTRTLALMVGSGVSILEGLSITAGVIHNRVISEAVEDAAEQVEKGFPVAFAFARHPEAFPYILSQMIAVGEETGKTEEVLSKLGRIFEIESGEKVKGLTAAIEPILMVFLGLGVAFLVISIIMPIYNLTSQF